MEEQIRNYQKILKNNPTDVPAFTALEEIYKGKDRWKDLVGLYEQRITHLQDDNEIMQLYSKGASVWHHKLQNHSQAEKAYLQVLRLRPDDRSALEGMVALYDKQRNWSRLANYLEQLAAITGDSSERADIFFRLGKLYRDNLQRTDRALVAFGHAHVANPERIDVLDALEKLYLDLGFYEKVLELIHRQARVAGVDEQTLGEKYLKLGMILQDEPLLEDLCRQALQQAASLGKDPVPAQEALARLDESKKDYESRVKQLRLEAVEAPDKSRAVTLYREIAEIYFLQGDHDGQVEENLDKCLLLQPGNNHVLAFMERYYLKKRRVKELIDKLTGVVDRTKDKHVAASILERIAMLNAVHLQDKETAIAAYRRILDLDPQYSSAVASLVEFYQEEGRWAEVVDLLKGQVDKIDDPEAKVQILFQIAKITSDQLKDPEAAKFLFEEILRLDGENLSTAIALEKFYSNNKDYNGLVRCLEIRLAHTHDKKEKLKLLEKLADIHLEYRDDPVEAFKSRLRSFAVDPEPTKTLNELLSLSERTGRYQEMAAVCRTAVNSGRLEGKGLLAVLSALADIQAQKLSNTSEAIRVYQEILDVDPKNMPALAALEKLQELSGGSMELVAIYKRQLELVRSGQKKKELLFKLAEIYRERMADYAQAVDAYREILKIDEDDAEAWSALSDLYERDGQWQDAAHALEKSLEFQSEATKKLELQYRLAGIFEQRLNDTENSLLLCNSILSAQQVDAELAANTVRILERLQGRGVSPLRIAEILQPYYALAGDWRRHIDMLELRLEGCSTAAERLSLLERIAQVYEEELDQKDLAFAALGRAFKENPDLDTLGESLFRLAKETGRFEDLAGILEDSLSRELVPDMMARINLMLGDLYRQQLNRPQNAIACYRKAMEHRPDDVGMLSSLSELLRSVQRWDELAGILRKREQLAGTTEEKRTLLLELGELLESELHDRPSAIAVFQELDSLLGDDLEVLRRLGALLEKGGMWPDFAQVLERIIPLVEHDEASDLTLKLGKVRAERMEEREHAIEHYQQVLAERPDDERAIEAVESLLDRPDIAPAAAEILQPVYERKDNWSGLVRVMEVKADASQDKDQQVDILIRVAQIYDRHLSQSDRAFASLRKAYRISPSSQDVLLAMERQAQKSGAYESLTAALEEALESIDDRDQQIMMLQTLAGLYRDKLRRPDLATASLRRLVELNPLHTSALSSLEVLYRDSKSFPELAWVLSLQAEASTDPEARRDLFVQTAQILEEQVGDLDGAVDAYRKVLESDSEDLSAAKQLDRLYQATGRWEDEVELLPRLANLSKNVLGLIDYNSRLADIFVKQLDEPRKAVQIYKGLLEKKPNHPETIVSLEKLLADDRCRLSAAEVLEGVYRANQEWRKLAAILEMRLAATTELDDRLGFFRQLMDIFENKMNERAMAFTVAARAFRENPSDEGIDADLVRLAGEGNLFEEQVGVYLDVAERNAGTDMAVNLRKRVAAILERHLGRREEAVAELEKLLDSSYSDQDILYSLERMYREEGDFSSLVKIYLRQVDLATDLERKKDLLFQAAATLAEGVEDVEGSIGVYHQILDLDASDQRAWRLLDQLLVASERWTDLLSVLDGEIALLESSPAYDTRDSDLLDLLLRKTQLCMDRLNDPAAALKSVQAALGYNDSDPRAVEFVERMLTLDSTRAQAADILDPIYRKLSDYKKLVAIMEVRLAARQEPEQRLSLYRELMTIYEQELEQKPLAFMVACRAIRENAGDDGIRQDLERLANESGSFEELANVYEEILPLTDSMPTHAEIERRLAQLKEAYLEEKDEAVSHWRQVLASDPDDLDALKSLERLYRERGSWSELVGIVRHMASLEEDSDKKKDLLHEVATLMEERLGNNAGAIEAYGEILADDPRDVAVLKLQDRLLFKESRWEELCEVIKAQVELAADSELTTLKLRLAEIYGTHLQDKDLAVDLYSDILSAESMQPQAVDALITMFDAGELKEKVARILVGFLDQLEDWRHLIAALEVLHDSSDDVRERKELLVRISGIYDEKLSQKELAFNTLGRAFHTDPSDENVRFALERLAAETEEYEILAAVYSRRLDGLDDESISLALNKRLAALFAERLGDVEKAVEHLLAVVSLDPSDAPSLLSLEDYYRHKKDFEPLAGILRKRLALVEEPQEATSLLYEIATIYEQNLGDVGGALDAYREILARKPDDITSMRMLDRLCSQQGRTRELAQVLVDEIGLLDKTGQMAEALDLRFRLAQLYEQEFGDNDRAGSLYRDILQADPGHSATIEHLEEQLADGRSFEGAASLLETAYEKSGDWKKYLDILESQVRHSRVMARRLDLLSEIARIQEEKMGLSFMAFNTYVRMFHEDLTDPKVREGLDRLAKADDNLEALAAVYEEELDNIEEPSVGAQIALKVAKIQQQNLQDEDEALRFYRTCLRFEPKNLEALRALDGLYEKRGQWDDLVEVLSKQVDLLTEPELQADVLYRLGTILLEKLEQSSKSVGYFRRVLELDSAHLPSLRSLERAFAEQGDHESLYDVLKMHLEQVREPDDRLELVARIADLASGQLDKPDEAVELWKGILEQDPTSEDALDALDRLYEKTARWRELAQLIEMRMQSTADPEKIADLSSRLGWVKGEKLGELEEAMANWQEVLRLDPKNLQALNALRGIYASGGQWEELLGVLRKLVPLQSEMTDVKHLRFELADILGEKLDRKDEAIEAAKRALDIEPHSPKDLERLARIFQTNEAWQDAVAVLEQAVEQRQADVDKIELLLEIALLWKDKISRPLGAAPAYEKILELDPFHEEAYRACQEIYRDNKEWRRLAAILEGRLVHIRERKDRLELIKDIAEIYEQRLGQKELAFAKYCAAFREDFSDDAVLVKLENLAADTEDYETLLEVLEDATTEVTTGSRAVGLLHKVADIYRNRMGDFQRAEEFLSKAMELDKRDVTSLDGLADLYEGQERWEDLIRVLETKYERSDELEGRKEIRARIAYLQEEKQERIDAAIESYRRIMELDGRDTMAIQSLIRLYQLEERWHELISMLRRAAEQADDREIALNYLYNIATIWETELDSDEEAIDAYKVAVEFEPSHLASLQALERIYTRLDSWSELLQVFEKQVALVDEIGEKIKIYSKMGSIWEERFSNVDNAAACHASILELDPENLSSIKALERLVRRMGDFGRLIELYYTHIGLIDDRDEIVGIHLAIGDVWYHELNRVDKAEDTFNKALEIDERSTEAIHALGQLYEKSGNWFNAIEMLKKEAELCGATPEAVDLYYRMGKINEDMLLDSGAARDSYQKSLTIDPSYLPAIKALKLIYYLDKQYDDYLEMMAQEAEHSEDIEEKTRLYNEIGKFLQEQRDDSAEAARYYEEALALTPDFLSAAKPLADIYFRSEQWEQAEKMMEVVVAGLDRNSESKELCRQYYRLGYITEKLGKEDRALEHYRMSYELDATYLPALEGLGNALLRTEQWEDAYRIYQTILIHHRDSLSDAEVAELYWQIGDVNFQMGEVERAIDNFRKALDIDDTHLSSMQYLFRTHEEQENWEEAYEYGLQMLEQLDEDEIYEHRMHMAELCLDHLQDPFRAVEALLGALNVQPDSQEALVKLRDVYLETKQYQKAAGVIEKLIETEGRPSKLVELHVQVAELLHNELRDDNRAVEHLNLALDTDPSFVKAFMSISQILSERKDWLALKENYIKMIKRLPVSAQKTKLALWKDLGELCRVVLRNLNESIDAYKMITSLDPDDVDALSILGELLAAKQGGAQDAMDAHHRVISLAADRINSYRSLWKLYNKNKEYDPVFVITSILRHLKKADAEEQKIVSYFSKRAPSVASRPVTDHIWNTALAHPGVKVPFTKIFGLMYRMAPDMFLVKDLRDVGIKRKEHQVDLARDRSLFAHNFRLAAKVLGGPDVELFALKDQQAKQLPGLAIAMTKPTSIIAYKDVFQQDKKKYLLFQIGRKLAMTRPEFILACVLPIVELNNLLQAACLLVNQNHKIEGASKGVDRARSGLKRHLDPKGMGLIKRAVTEYLSKKRAYNLKRWVESVEHSVNRAGLITCADLSTSLAILRRESAGITPMRPVTKVTEILKFATSKEHFKIRKELGLAVDA